MHLKHPQSADKNTVFLDCVAYIKPFQTTTRARQVIAPLAERRHEARSVPLAQAHFLEVATESRVRAENPKLYSLFSSAPQIRAQDHHATPAHSKERLTPGSRLEAYLGQLYWRFYHFEEKEGVSATAAVRLHHPEDSTPHPHCRREFLSPR